MGGPTPPKKVKSIRKDPLYLAGHQDGFNKARKLSLDFLEQKYMQSDLDTSTPRGQAVLELAREVAQHLREHQDDR